MTSSYRWLLAGLILAVSIALALRAKTASDDPGAIAVRDAE